MPTPSRFALSSAFHPTLRLLSLWLALLTAPGLSHAQTTYTCGGEGESPCAADTEFFWSNGNLFCDRGLKATGFNVLPDISFNVSNTIDLNQADLSQLLQLINNDWPALESRLSGLDEHDFLYQECAGIEQDGQCWTTPPADVPGFSAFGGPCVPVGVGEISNCTAHIPGVPGTYVWLPDPSKPGWQVPGDLVDFIGEAQLAVGALPGDLDVSLPPPPDPTGILAFDDLTDINFSSFSTALTTLKNLPSHPFFTLFEDLGNDFAAPPGTCVNETRRQAAATAVEESWTHWALAQQRELAKHEPLNWTTQVNAHNAYNTAADGYPIPNQEYSITDQLRMGVRVLSLDVHWFNDRMRLCHGQSSHSGCAAVDRFLDGGLKELANWLDAHPDEVVLIGLEDYLDGNEGTFDHLLATYLGEKVYRGADIPAHLANGPDSSNVRARVNGSEAIATRWPTLHEMRAMDKQVIIVGNDDSNWTWYNRGEDGGKAKGLALGSNGHLSGCLVGDSALDLSAPGDRFLSVYEARSLLDPFEFAGLLNRLMIPGLAQCNVGYVGLDLIQAKEKTSDNICNTEYNRVLEDTGSSTLANLARQHCDTDNRRLTQFVWSWASHDEGQNGDYAVLSLDDGRFHSTSTGAHHYACAAPRDGDPTSWTDPRGETWRITEASGPWDEGERACIEEFSDENYYFAVPVNGWQNQQLLAAADDAGLGAGDAVWLDYRRVGPDTWQPDNTLPFSASVRTVAGDVDGNGRTDLVTTWHGSTTTRINVRAYDDGAFSSLRNQYPDVDWGSFEVYPGDFNGDGHMDLLWNDTWSSSGSLIVTFGQPDGTFDFDVDFYPVPVPPFSLFTDWVLHVADVNGDGISDLVATSVYEHGLFRDFESNAGHVQVALSNGDGTFDVGDKQTHSGVLAENTASVPFGGTDEPTIETRIHDITGDGKADVVWNVRSTTNRVYVGVASDDGTFDFKSHQDHADGNAWEPFTLRLADVDGDGADDLVWNRLDGSHNTLYVGLAAGDGTFDLDAPAQTHPADATWDAFDLYTGDLDGNGRADLVWNRRTDTENTWYLGVGQAEGTFMLSAPVQEHAAAIDWSPHTLFVADVTGTGGDALVWHDPAGTGITYVWTAPSALLPVELTAFTAKTDATSLVIEWQTASETNNAGFEVQEREGGGVGEWETLGFVEGAGTTSEPQSYRFRASDLDFGAYRLRLKQVDTDGATHLSEELEVTITLDQAYLVAAPYPNPSRGAATLEFAVREAQHVEVAAYDVLGRRIATLYDGEMPANRIERLILPGGRLPSGLYLLRAVGEGFAVTRRVTIVR